MVGKPQELRDGQASGATQRRLTRLLDDAAPDHFICDALGFGVQIGDSYFQPDVLVFRADTEGRTESYIAPADVLLAVEVLSPGNPGNDRVIKLNKYAEGGIPNYWIVDGQARRLTVYELVPGRSAYVRVAEVDAGTIHQTDRPFPVVVDPAEFCR